MLCQSELAHSANATNREVVCAYVRIEIQVHMTVEVSPKTEKAWKFLCQMH